MPNYLKPISVGKRIDPPQGSWCSPGRRVLNEGSSYKYRCQLAERAKLLAQAGDESTHSLLATMLKDWINDDNSLADDGSESD